MQVAQNASSKVLAVGSQVISYASARDFDVSKELDGQLKSLGRKEVESLKPGDTVFVDLEPMTPKGIIFGQVKCVVKRIEERGSHDSREYRIHYEGGSTQGFKTTTNGKCKEIKIAVNEVALAEIVERTQLSEPVCGPH